MGLTKKPYPNSKATKDWEEKNNPLRIGLDGSSVGDLSNKQETSGTKSSANYQQEQNKRVQSQELQSIPQTLGVADNNELQSGDIHSPSNLYPKDIIRTVHGHTTKLNKEKQEKHIPGSSSYQEGKSILAISLNEAQELINQFAGTGQSLNKDKTKERIVFDKIIGKYVEPYTKTNIITTVGIIHYSKSGTHIVPAKP